MPGLLERIATVIAPTSPEEIAAAGGTEAVNQTALTPRHTASLLNGAVPVRIVFSGSKLLTSQIATSSILVGPYSSFPDWEVAEGVSDYVYADAADGATAYQLWVWTSSP